MRRITTLFAGGALALSLFGVAAAGTLEDGYSAFNRGVTIGALLLKSRSNRQPDRIAAISLYPP
jgi:hypothetical protein